VIEDILRNKQFRRFFPPFAGVFFIGIFVSLGLWQLDRAQQKTTSLAQFAENAMHMPLNGQLPDKEFQAVEVRGRFLAERQILIENIVRDARVGYFVITPFQQSRDEPLLLINRGWLAKPVQHEQRVTVHSQIDINDDVRTIRGRAGRLPRVGMRAGAGFEGAGDWPKNATYPTLDEVAAELGEELLPFVLLLHMDEDDGFRRQWQPQQSGPMTNYGYAFQWFAMAVAVFCILVWRLRKSAMDHASE
jgi:surfeit locus 1 family protein